MSKLTIGAACALALLAVLAIYQLTKPAKPIEVRMAAGPAQPRVSAADAGIDMAAIEAASDYAGRRNSRALLIARGGHIVYERYWDGATLDTPARFDELTPTLTALLLGSALNDRLILDIDLPLSRYLPGHDDGGGLTVRSLLSGQDVETLALVLETVTKLPFETLVAERLWKPMGGGNVSFAVRTAAPREGRANASCCMTARIGDWLRIGQLLARDGVFEANQYTPPGFVSAMLRPTHRDAAHGHFVRVNGIFATRGVAWIGGRDHQRLWLVPSLDLVILRLGDDPSSEEGWDEALIPDSIIRGTTGWRPAGGGEKTDPKQFAPH
jgi:CubicO group peptidase (beta-lactamase class C family)